MLGEFDHKDVLFGWGDWDDWQALMAIHIITPLQHLFLDLFDPDTHQFLGHIDHKVVLHDFWKEGELSQSTLTYPYFSMCSILR